MSLLLEPLRIRELTLKNRVFMSPMCQYSCVDGVANDWHRTHLGTRAVGGVGLVITEATAVSAEGRITPGDLGLWNEQQESALKPIVEFIKAQGAAAGIQLAHAGRKASTDVPWRGGHGMTKTQGGWIPMAPSALAYNDKYITQKP